MSDLLSPFELKHLRQSIGASLARMAQLLGLSGNNEADTVRKMENGSKPISGPIQRLAKIMQSGIADSSMNQLLPEYLIGSDLEEQIDVEWIFHTRYPRFLAVVNDEAIEGLDCVSVDGVEWLCLAMWIDEPVDDAHTCLVKASGALEAYSSRTED